MNIKVYSTPTCSFCAMAKKYLESKGKEFEYIDVSKDQDAARTMIEKSGQFSVPVIEIDDHIIIGFNRAELDKYL